MFEGSDAAGGGDAAADVDVDVIVVGYGPTGSVLATLLAQQGHRVEVIERYTSTYALPRAVHFDGEVARVFQACGIGAQLPALTSSSGVYEWRNAAGQTLLRFPPVADSGTGWPGGNMFCQPDLERVLEARGAELGGLIVRRGVEMSAIEQHDDHVVVRHSDGETSARYVVGCDGSKSLVRTILDVPVTDLGFFYDWLICDVLLDEPRVYDPENLQVCDPHRPTTAVSGGPGRRRWEFMRLPHEDIGELDTERVAWELLAPWDVHPGNATLERHTVYTFQARWIDEWRVGRALLAGDAAHQMPPFAGQGMCSGVRDAVNLAWKLSHVLHGTAGEHVLDTYGAERRPHVRATIDLSMMLGGVICVPDPVAAEARDAEMMAAIERDGSAPMPPGPVVAAGLLPIGEVGGGVAGHLVVQGRVAADDEARRVDRFDDVVGVGWRLIVQPGVDVTLDHDLARWFHSVGGRVVVVADTGSAPGTGAHVIDVDGTYRRWFAERGIDGVLQRPDFLAFGAVSASVSASRLLEAARSLLVA